ncbi:MULTISPECIES: hypothetical protein [Actinomadura]|uniref:hypothetical protein n=1 Tax=Actinomadura TaxID=1988 RepID=UPI0003AD61C8|nr:hypothetical protein [Actinomadura madurae]
MFKPERRPSKPRRLVRFAEASTSGLRDRRWARAAALVVIAGLLGSGLWMLRWSGGGSTATPDTFWYARDALRYAGHSPAEADRTAAEITCGAMKRDRARWRLTYTECLRYRTRLPAKAPVRFQRIFTSRPGYPLLAVPFVRVMGTTGFAAATAALGVACGIAVVLLALAIGLRPVQALIAETLFYLLPTGLWGSRLLAEAPMMLCLLVALIGTVLLLRGRNAKTAVGLLACGLALLCAVKPANGVALAAALAAGAVLSLPFATSRRTSLAVTGIATLVLAGNLWISSALHLPGVHETLQDTFTRHFRLPDVTDPWQRLADASQSLWTDAIAQRMLEAPLIPAAFLFAAVGLFARLRWDAAWPLALAGLTGALVASMHPLVYELDRLSVVTWIPVAFGLAALTTHHPRKGAAPHDLCSTQEQRPPIGSTSHTIW